MAGRLKIWDGSEWKYVDSSTDITASWAYNAVNANTASVSTTASFALTASSADTFRVRSYIDLTSADPAYAEGRVFYNTDTHTLNVYNDRSNVTLNVGEENWIRVVNKTGVTISNGVPVTISGSQGNRPKVILAQSHASSQDHHEFDIVGVATEDILDNEEGVVTTLGIVRGIDTSGWSPGDTLYVSSSAGQLTVTRPSFPYDIIKVGITLNSTNSGSIFVYPQDAIHADDISGDGSLNITASRAISSSYALSASYAPGGGGMTLVTGSTYPITASWSNGVTGSVSTNNITFATASTFTYGSGSVVAHRTALKILQLTPAAYAALSGSTDAETLYIVTE